VIGSSHFSNGCGGGCTDARREGPLVDVDPSTLRDLSDAGLYNLSEDIGETRNRAAERPDKVKELSDLWQQWNRQLLKPLWGPRPVFGRGGA
jgi:hypothetical protein